MARPDSWGPSPVSPIGTSLERHIIERQRSHPDATGDFTRLFLQLSLASRIIASRVKQAGLADVLGLTGEVNVQGEKVQKLDQFANDTIIRCVEAGGHVCVMASEEIADPITIPPTFQAGKYVLLFDPLDGSSNVDVNVPVGTIFSVLRRTSSEGPGVDRDCLQPGSNQVAAGYIVYGSSTMLVYTTGDGVHGFTLDPLVGEYFLSHENITIPERGKTYSINEGNTYAWSDGVRRWVSWMKEPAADGSRPYKSRYIGTLVADFHRVMLQGGVFAYPADANAPRGKLRLLYEASPLAFLAEAAGGAASDGVRRILDIAPTELHQRVALYIGHKDEVAKACEFVRT